MSRRQVLNANRQYTVEEIQLRLNIRDRALLYAEYHYYSAALQRNEFDFDIDLEEFRLEVIIIELDLMYDEGPELRHIHLSNFEPTGIFFGQPPLNSVSSSETDPDR